jgi:hypothetical protein
MTTQKPGCLASILSLFRSRKKDDGISIQYNEPEKLPYRLRDDFLSNAEASFFQVLKTMIGDHLVICPKVSLAELFFVPRSNEAYQIYQNKIDRKRIDFLLCNPQTLRPVFAIELDDSSHERPDRQARDAFVEEVFATTELPLVRVPAQLAYNTHDLAALFQAATQKKQTISPIEKASTIQQVETPICPKCGVSMVLRVAKRGSTPGQQFYGCPNYPRCRVVIPLKLPAS